MIEEEAQPSFKDYVGARSENAPLLAVGIGVSTGGADALQALFGALGRSEGLSFVIVEHLDGSAQSVLTSMLRQATPLAVVEIVEGEALVSDRVFLAPPNAIVELHGTTFRLHAPGSPEERRAPIDAFMRSLAVSFGPRAAGVILSGGGGDGTAGVQRVAHEGGLTFVQRPDEAKNDTMPLSGLTSGVVDHVLPASAIGQELLQHAQHLRDAKAEASALGSYEAVLQTLPEICDLLQKATDHNFKHYKTSTLVRRTQRRMQVLRLDTAESYRDRLRHDPEELTQLFRELLVGVTSFFRDAAAFERLTAEVIAPLVAQHRSEPLRFWVPGCATGEEAYSLAIVVREAISSLAEPPAVQIFATDINERALAVARQGLYPASIAADVGKDRLERFFVKKGKRYQVAKEVRELCMFSPHNLIGDPPFSRLDLISCRNLLIYFGPHLQKKVIPLFHYALRSNGYLFLGPSENISTHRELFSPVNAKFRISQRRATAISSAALVGGAGNSRGSARHLMPEAIAEPDLYQLMQRMLLDEFSPKAVIATDDGQILSASGEMDRYLTVTEGTFQNNVVRLARPGLRVGLRAALSEAIKSRRKVVHDKVSVQTEAGFQRVQVTVQPMPRLGQDVELFLIVFQDLGPLLPRDESSTGALSAEADSLIEQLERELSTTRDDLEKTIQDLEAANEELKSSNEELLSMNEELQSANEELETSKEQVQASNEALARAHANLSNLLTSTTIATIFLDDNLNIQSFTPAVETIYNVLPSDVGRPLNHITHRCREMPPLPPPAALRSQDTAREDSVRTEDGSWYLRRAHPYKTHDGKAEGLVVTFIDVTQLEQAKRESLHLRDQLQLITDSLPVLISYVDVHQRYRFNNLAYERWFDVPRDSLRGRHVRELLGDATYELAAPHILRALAGDAVGYETEYPFRDTRRVIRVEYVPDRGVDGEIRGYVSVKYDVTEARLAAQSLAEAKRAAEKANVAKSDFLANMSHEIRTPLSSILGYGELLEAHTVDPDNLACIDAIRRNGRHLLEIVNDILDLSKIEAGMLRAELVRMAPGGILRDAVESLRVRAAEKGLSLDLSHEGPLPATIESDPTRLRQVLLNLLSNAIKFTERGGIRVSVRLLASSRLLEIEVADTGIGISPERQVGLFVAFTQADSSINRRYGGTGLGLAISKRLVELLGGNISVASSEGQGSKFSFTVATGPLDEVEVRDTSPPPAPVAIPVAARLDGRRILIVDDRRDMRYLIQSYVEEAGAGAIGASDGSQAIERVREAVQQGTTFDAIILDIQMPVMDGFRAAPALRAEGYTGLIIALTANAMKGDEERCRAAGCNEYMSKPVDRLRLLQALAQRPAATNAQASPSTREKALPELARASAAYRHRVLLVDDDRDSVELMCIYLEQHGIDVQTARTGARAVELATTLRPDVVILDLGLPDMDGYAVLEHLKANQELRGARFIALTGRSGREDQRQMVEAGFHWQVTKPADLQHLVQLVRAAK